MRYASNKKENDLIFKGFVNSQIPVSILREDVDRLQQIVSSGADAFFNKHLGSIGNPIIIVNVGSSGASPEDSILTSAAYEALSSSFKDPNISGEGDVDHDDFVGAFWEPSEWVRITNENVGRVPESTMIINHNGEQL